MRYTLKQSYDEVLNDLLSVVDNSGVSANILSQFDDECRLLIKHDAAFADVGLVMMKSRLINVDYHNDFTTTQKSVDELLVEAQLALIAIINDYDSATDSLDTQFDRWVCDAIFNDLFNHWMIAHTSDIQQLSKIYQIEFKQHLIESINRLDTIDQPQEKWPISHVVLTKTK